MSDPQSVYHQSHIVRYYLLLTDSDLELLICQEPNLNSQDEGNNRLLVI